MFRITLISRARIEIASMHIYIYIYIYIYILIIATTVLEIGRRTRNYCNIPVNWPKLLGPFHISLPCFLFVYVSEMSFYITFNKKLDIIVKIVF